jgi:hypothetical protein
LLDGSAGAESAHWFQGYQRATPLLLLTLITLVFLRLDETIKCFLKRSAKSPAFILQDADVICRWLAIAGNISVVLPPLRRQRCVG